MQVRSAHKHDVAKDILMIIHTGALLTPHMFEPGSIRMTLHKFWRLSRHSPPQLRRSLKYLLSRGLLKVDNDDGVHNFALTEQGARKVSRLELEDLSIPIPLSWDGRWRIVSFEVPEEKKSARNALSQHLRAMGFYKLDDSMWVHPYPCEKELTTLRHALGISEHVRLIVAESIENDTLITEHFHLEKT